MATIDQNAIYMYWKDIDEPAQFFEEIKGLWLTSSNLNLKALNWFASEGGVEISFESLNKEPYAVYDDFVEAVDKLCPDESEGPLFWVRELSMWYWIDVKIGSLRWFGRLIPLESVEVA